MRTAAPTALPLFRSEMQARLLALVLLQPERSWTLDELVRTLGASRSSVHREVRRATDAGIVREEDSRRPHEFRAATDDPVTGPLAEVLQLSVGVEDRLRGALAGLEGIAAAAIFGSWVTGGRTPSSDIDVLVVGTTDLRTLRRTVRPAGDAIGRRIDVTSFTDEEFRAMASRDSSFTRALSDGPYVALVGSLEPLLQ